MNKEQYIKPDLEVICFEEQDVIVTSNIPGGQGEDDTVIV